MTHDEAQAQIAALFEGAGSADGEALREHLQACEACRARYDQTALTLRRLLGAPDEMTPEELALFAPPLPPAPPAPLRRHLPALALALAACLAGAVVWWSSGASPAADGFGVRGGPAPRARPASRAVCLRGEQVVSPCSAGDTVAIAVTPLGFTHVKLLAGDRVVGEGDVGEQPDTPLPWTVAWSEGLKLEVVFSECAGCAPAASVDVAP